MSDPASPQNRSNGANRVLDQFGIGIAGLCALHCIGSLAAISGLGIGGHFLFDPQFHEIGLLLAVIVAAVAIGWGALKHRRAAPFVIAMMGLTFMGGALGVGHGSEEAVLTIIGVALVSIGHLLNLRGGSVRSRA